MGSTSKMHDDQNESGDSAVAQRYAAAANEREPALCCPVSYDAKLLEPLPQEIIDKDYGCGDPSAYVRPGDTVLDLGSGGGKLCYMAAQIVGANGRVIGVDCNEQMLSLAQKYQAEMAAKLGYDNVEFHFGRIQDLQLDLDELHQRMDEIKVGQRQRSLDVLNLMRSLRRESPMIPDASVDCVISNCVLNLVDGEDRRQLFQEIYRVLKVGGRAAISDIVCDEDVPADMQADGHLWSGCISGAWREDRFIDEFTQAGFYGATIDTYVAKPWQVIRGIEFRSATVLAYKGAGGGCFDHNQAVIYKGPFSHVKDDDGQVYQRGQRTAVCNKTYDMLSQPPYDSNFVPVPPIQEVATGDVKELDCKKNSLRSPRETKGHAYDEIRILDNNDCEPGGNCC